MRVLYDTLYSYFVLIYLIEVVVSWRSCCELLSGRAARRQEVTTVNDFSRAATAAGIMPC